jgi:hypothetical protein
MAKFQRLFATFCEINPFSRTPLGIRSTRAVKSDRIG